MIHDADTEREYAAHLDSLDVTDLRAMLAGEEEAYRLACAGRDDYLATIPADTSIWTIWDSEHVNRWAHHVQAIADDVWRLRQAIDRRGGWAVIRNDRRNGFYEFHRRGCAHLPMAEGRTWMDRMPDANMEPGETVQDRAARFEQENEGCLTYVSPCAR